MLINKFEISKNKKASLLLEFNCDDCNEKYTILEHKIKYLKNYNKDLCSKCRHILNMTNLKTVGTKALKNISKDDKIKYTSYAGKISHIKNPNNKGKFSTERWNNMSVEEQQKQVTKANEGLLNKLKDENYKINHFKKIYKNSTIGYISKAQKEIYNELSKIDNTFELEKQIGSYKIDIYNERLKLCIEYNGDAFHCNPKLYEKNFYSTLIKMTAEDKWKLDRKKYNYLQRNEYSIFVIWESDWKNNKQHILDKLKNKYNEIS